MIINRHRITVQADGRTITPSPHQWRLLCALEDAGGAVVGRHELAMAVWPGCRGAVTDQAMDQLVRRLRMEIDPEHRRIVTVRGHGFRLEEAE